MSNQATIADRFVLKRATEVAGEFINSCCGPPHDYSIAALTARKICLQWSKKSFATLSLGERTSRNAVGMSISCRKLPSAKLHSMTSSAVNKRLGGIVNLSP